MLVQAEIETFALRPDGEVAWRVAHSDVVTEAELVGGRLVLTSFDGQVRALDPADGPSTREVAGVRVVPRPPLAWWTNVDNSARCWAVGGG